MWPFKDKNTDVKVEKTTTYDNGVRREKSWVAWLLAILTMLVTIILALALFYGGRWVYRQVFDNDDNTTQTENQGTSVSETGEVQSGDGTSTTGGDGSSQSGSQGQSHGSGSQGGSSSNNSGTSGQSGQSGQQPTTGPTPTTTPRTGPDDSVPVELQ